MLDGLKYNTIELIAEYAGKKIIKFNYMPMNKKRPIII